MHKKLTFLWFILGLGSRLQIVASLSITEIIVLASAPFLFLKNYRQLKNDGLGPFFILSVMVIVGCIIASVINHTPIQYVIRGMAATCIVACSIIFSHWMLRRDPGGFKWFILGLPISAILSTFFFRSAVEVATLGDSTEEIMAGPIFWISRLNPLVMAATKGWYLHVPTVINVCAPIFMASFAILTSISGRSSALTTLAFAMLVVIGGKSRRSISRISRHFWMLCTIGLCFISSAYMAYKISASRGWLGEDARKKYESQTKGGRGGVFQLLVGGRAESFIGLLACRDKPIIGWGPWAKDEGGYVEEFMVKYGTWEDVANLMKMREWYGKLGVSDSMLPCHAAITEFWAWYGIWGLVFWLYIVYVMVRYLKQDVFAVPQWYAWLACSVPGMFWALFFSPFSDRFGFPLFVVACLMARAVRKGKFQLPNEMIAEMERLGR